MCLIGEPHVYTKIRKPRKSNTPLEPPASLLQAPIPETKDTTPPPIPPHPDLESSQSLPSSSPNQTISSQKHHQPESWPSQLNFQHEYVSMQSMSDASGSSSQCELMYIEMKSASTVSERSVNFDFPPRFPPDEPYVLMRSMSETSDEQPAKRKMSLPARLVKESQYIAMSPPFVSPTSRNFLGQQSTPSLPLVEERCQVEEGSDYVAMKSAK